MTRRVLVIEKDDAIRATMEWLLTVRGYDVRGARTCAEAIAGDDGVGLDVVMSDILLDAPEGTHEPIELASRWGAKLLLMLGPAGQPRAKSALARADVWVLLKPFTPNALLTTLEEMIRA